jgi:truncated hemoglobin YjbI
VGDAPASWAAKAAVGCSAGGPATYSEQHGGHGHMVAEHLARSITEPQRRRWVNLIQDAAGKAGLPTDAEFRSAFLAYVEWGTRLAVRFSGADAAPPAGAAGAPVGAGRRAVTGRDRTV